MTSTFAIKGLTEKYTLFLHKLKYIVEKTKKNDLLKGIWVFNNF